MHMYIRSDYSMLEKHRTITFYTSNYHPSQKIFPLAKSESEATSWFVICREACVGLEGGEEPSSNSPLGDRSEDEGLDITT